MADAPVIPQAPPAAAPNPSQGVPAPAAPAAPPPDQLVPLVNTQTGQEMRLPTHEAGNAYLQRAAGLPKGTQVPVFRSDGTQGTVDSSELHLVLQQGGRFATPAEAASAQAQQNQMDASKAAKERFSYTSPTGLLNNLAAGNIQVADAALAGLPSAAISAGMRAYDPKLADYYRDFLNQREEARPIASFAQKAGGFGLGMALGGAAAGVAKGALGIGRAAQGLGALAEGAPVAEGAAAAAKLGIPNSVAGWAAAAARAGARGGAELGAYGGMEEASRQVVQNEPLSMEKIGLAALQNAAVGGVLGAVGKVGELGVKAGVRAAGEALEPVAASFGKLARNAEGNVADAAQKAGGELHIAALDSTGKYAEEVQKEIGSAEQHFQNLKRDGLVPTTLGGAKAATAESRLAAAKTVDSQLRGDLGTLSALADNAGAKTTMGEVRAAMLGPFADMSLSAHREAKSVYNFVERHVNEMARSLGAVDKMGKIIDSHPVSVPELFERKADLDKLLTYGKGLDNVTRNAAGQLETQSLGNYGALRVARQELDKVALNTIETARGIGKDAKAVLNDLASRLKSVKLEQEAAERTVVEKLRSTGLSDLQAFQVASSIANGHFISGPLVAAASKLVGKDRSRAVMSFLATSAAEKLGKEAVEKSVDNTIKKGVDGLLDKTIALKRAEKQVIGSPQISLTPEKIGEAVGQTKVRAFTKSFDQLTKEVATAAADDTTSLRNARMVDPGADITHPVAQYTARGLAYLVTQLPKGIERPGVNAGVIYPEDKKQAFMEKYEAVTNPGRVMRDFQRGRVTRGQLDAMMASSPELFKEFQRQTELAAIAKQAEGKLSYESALKVGHVLGKPFDPSMDPKVVASLQNTFIPPPAPKGKGGGGGGGHGIPTFESSLNAFGTAGGKRR